MPDTYRTVAGRGETRFEIRGSTFVGHVGPATDRESAEAFVAEVSDAHADATHTVPAYRVRVAEGPLREWADDDGEPGGSAGEPALNVLTQEELVNVVAVVTRYYGGTNLGVGGLARAYSQSVAEALEVAGITEREPRERFTVELGYDDSGTVRGLLEGSAASFEATYEERVRFDVRAPESTAARLRDRIRSATSGRADID